MVHYGIAGLRIIHSPTEVSTSSFAERESDAPLIRSKRTADRNLPLNRG